MKYLSLALFCMALSACNVSNEGSADIVINDAVNKINDTVKNDTSAAKQSSIKVSTCEPDYQPINYCTDSYVKRFNQEAKLPANFDRNKRIVTTKLKMEKAKISEINTSKIIYEHYFVILDLDKRTATPVTEILTNFSDENGYLADIKPQVKFNNQSNQICFTGSLIGYRYAHTNIGNACYEFDSDNSFTSPVNAPFEEVDVKALKNTKDKSEIFSMQTTVEGKNSSKAISISNNKTVDRTDRVIFSAIDGEVVCKLKNCTRKPFDSELYEKLFTDSKNGPAGVTIGTYYNIENSHGLDIYAAGYTEEGEVNFDYVIVNNGNRTRYIELPMNSNYSIDDELVINGYSSTVPSFNYKIDSKGLILKIK